MVCFALPPDSQAMLSVGLAALHACLRIRRFHTAAPVQVVAQQHASSQFGSLATSTERLSGLMPAGGWGTTPHFLELARLI